MKTIDAVAKALRALDGRFEVRKATVVLSERETVKVARRIRPSRRDSRLEFAVTVGTPNYEEKHFIRRCRKAGEPLPVRKVLLKPYPAKR